MSLKHIYQGFIQKILDCSSFPGITFQELEQFKQDFRTSAFTCRLWSCPHATLGFSTASCLTRHEKDHFKHVCRVPGCQVPPFTSARMLKDHVAECHTSSQRVVRTTIRARVETPVETLIGTPVEILTENPVEVSFGTPIMTPGETHEPGVSLPPSPPETQSPTVSSVFNYTLDWVYNLRLYHPISPRLFLLAAN